MEWIAKNPQTIVFTGFFVLSLIILYGELLGIEWKDFQDNVVTIKRTSNYTVKKGVYTDTPKTNSSYRSLKLPNELMVLINEYKEYQQNYIISLGDKWEDTDRLFTTWNGKPMFPNTPSLYFGRFCKKTSLRYVNVHQWRHLNASLLINGGVDVKTVQNCLGHSSANTTLSIYAHTFQMAQAKAMGVVSDSLNLKKSLAV